MAVEEADIAEAVRIALPKLAFLELGDPDAGCWTPERSTA